MPDYGPILFVDDEAPMRAAVTQWLGLAGFETLVHDKAATALGRLNAVDVFAANPDLPFRDFLQSGDNAQQGGFSAS